MDEMDFDTNSLDPTNRYIFVIILLVSLFFGNLYSVTVLSLVKQNGGIKKPMNIMIFLDIFAKILCNNTQVLVVIAVHIIGTDDITTISRAIGPGFCVVSRYIADYGYSSNVVSGLGVAIFRLLYIKYTYAMEWGEKRIAFLIICIAQAFSHHGVSIVSHLEA